MGKKEEKKRKKKDLFTITSFVQDDTLLNSKVWLQLIFQSWFVCLDNHLETQ